jgi:hypothetical protein
MSGASRSLTASNSRMMEFSTVKLKKWFIVGVNEMVAEVAAEFQQCHY